MSSWNQSCQLSSLLAPTRRNWERRANLQKPSWELRPFQSWNSTWKGQYLQRSQFCEEELSTEVWFFTHRNASSMAFPPKPTDMGSRGSDVGMLVKPTGAVLAISKRHVKRLLLLWRLTLDGLCLYFPSLEERVNALRRHVYLWKCTLHVH